MIRVAEGGRHAICKIPNISIIPPGKGIRPGHFKKAEYGEKGGYPNDEIDKLLELGSRSHCVNG